MALIECWKHGVKVLPTTPCDHFDNGKTCGDHPECFFRSNVAKWQFKLGRKLDDMDEENYEVEEKQAVKIDDAFF